MNRERQLDNLILASGSPRRKLLFEKAGFEFQVIIPDEAVEAGVSTTQPPDQFVLEASFKKAESIASGLVDAIVVAADTVAVCDGQILGKPVDRDHARRMLTLLNGQQHFVLTGVTVWHRPSDRKLSRVVSTQMQMAKLSEKQIEIYLDTDDWIGKAGSFGYQDGLDWVSVVDGLESNVVGLPVEILDGMIGEVLSQRPPVEQAD